MPKTENFNYYVIQILLTVFKRLKINISEINCNICKNELIQRCQVNKVKSLH